MNIINQTLGEMIKNQRIYKEATTYDLAEMVGVSNSYISQIENGGRYPAKKLLFKLAHWLGIHNDNEFSSETLIKKFADERDFSEDILIKEFNDFRDSYLDDLTTPLKKFADDFSNNRIEVKRNSDQIKRTEKPYYDLKWLLEQNEFELFYGREYDIQDTMFKSKDAFEKTTFNMMNHEDIKLIKEIVDVIISNKYKKFPNNEK